MNKKAIAAALVVLLIAAGGLAWWQMRPAEVSQAVPVAPKAAPATAVATEPAPPKREVTARVNLEGRDFTLLFEQAGEGSPWSMNLTFANGREVKTYVGIDERQTKLENLVFSDAKGYQLQALMPGEPHEQLVGNASERLNFGEGGLDLYTIHRVEDNRLVEVARLVTGRERNAEGDKPALQLKAKVTVYQEGGKPLIDYTIEEGPEAPKHITFTWDGKAFVDSSGEYRRLLRDYDPAMDGED